MGTRRVVFIHGAGDAGAAWDCVGKLVQDVEVEWDAPDLFALVDDPSPSIETYADAVGAYCDASESSDIVLGGHSMGSLVALEVAGRRPGWLVALVLVCTGTPMRVSSDLLEMAAVEPDQAAALIAKWSHDRDFLADNPLAPASHEAATSHVPSHTLASDLAACDTYDAALSAACEVSVPVTVVVAGEDRMVPPEAADPIVETLEVVETVTVEGVGHRVQWEAPDQVADVIIAAATDR